MILINNKKLDDCASDLLTLKREAISVSKTIGSPTGSAAQKADECFDILLTIVSRDLPELFESSASMLSAISKEIRRVDNSTAESIRNG